MKRSLAIVLALAVAMPAGATINTLSVHRITKQDLRESAKRRRQEQAFCRKAQKAKGQLAKLGSLKKLLFDQRYDYTYLLERGEGGCPKDVDLAIALAETLVADQSPWLVSEDYMGRLLDLLRIRDLPADRNRADELSRYLAVRGNYLARVTPTWTTEERRAFVARDDVWAQVSTAVDGSSTKFTLHLEAVLDPLSPHYNPATAIDLLQRSSSVENWVRAARMLLDGRLVPADLPRADAILWRAVMHSDDAVLMLVDLHQGEVVSKDPAVRQLFLAKLLPFVDRTPPRGAAVREQIAPYYVPGLTNPDPQVQTASAGLLTRWAAQGTQSILPPLLAWIEPRLVSTDKAIASEARSFLRMLVEAGVTSAYPIMNREYARLGGLIQGGDWTPDPAKPVTFDKYFTSNDYPTRAMREERGGVVRATAVFGPDGRIFIVEITGSSGSPDLDQAVRSTLWRRMRWAWPEHPGRYVRVKLPPIQFRIIYCDDEPPAPPVEYALQVDAKANCRPPDMTVVY